MMASPSPNSSPVIAPSDTKSPSRRSSFGFLHRSKSRERLRKTSGGKIIKTKASQSNDEELRRLQANPMPQSLPKLPDFDRSSQLHTFGGENFDMDGLGEGNAKPSTDSRNGRLAVPPAAAKSQSPEIVDPYARTESMAHRGRYSYATSAVSSIDSPRRVRRRKDPTPFNVLVVGARNAGKTSFINFLQTSLTPKKRLNRPHDAPKISTMAKKDPNFEHHYLETEIDGERVGVTLWDSPGLEKGSIDLQLRDASSFIESKFEETFSEEMKVFRAPGVQDTHIHCVFLLLDPIRLDGNLQEGQTSSDDGQQLQKRGTPPRIVGALDEDFDLQVLRTLRGKTTVIPLISKADTVTTGHMAFLKRKVDESLKRTGLDPLEALNFDVDEDSEAEEGKEVVGIIERFDEREEDEDHAKDQPTSPESADGRASPHTSDSETLPHNRPPLEVPRRNSRRERPRIPSGDNTESNGAAAAAAEATPLIPYSTLSPDSYSLKAGEGQGPIGRRFPWGFADPYNPEHCDFTQLKDTCFGDWRAELREASREIWYERWRTSRLNSPARGGADRGDRGAVRGVGDGRHGNGTGTPGVKKRVGNVGNVVAGRQ